MWGLVCLQDGWRSSLRLPNEPWWTHGGKGSFLHKRHNGSLAVSSQLPSGSFRHKGKKRRKWCCYSVPWYRQFPASLTARRCSLCPEWWSLNGQVLFFRPIGQRKGLGPAAWGLYLPSAQRCTLSLIHWFVLKGFLKKGFNEKGQEWDVSSCWARKNKLQSLMWD